MKLKNIKFQEGNLSGITLNMNPEYVKFIFQEGNTDIEMMSDIWRSNPLGKTIFDVGAFIGSSSLVFSKYVGKQGKVISFEPNQYNYNKIKKNLLLNPEFSKRIKVFDLALADFIGETTMTLSDDVDNGPSSTSRLNVSHPTIQNSDLPINFQEMNVKVTTLDEFASKEKIFPDIIKIDIEGSEHTFLAGAVEIIKKYKPLIYIEIHSEFCALKCYEILQSLGYHLTVLKEEQDNRIMVRCEFVGNIKKFSSEEVEKLSLKAIETSIGVFQEIEKVLEERNLLKGILINQFDTLDLQNKFLVAEIKDKDNMINELKSELGKLQNSKSWIYTRPFRNLISLLKKNNSKNE